jgi:hypothetical protein
MQMNTDFLSHRGDAGDFLAGRRWRGKANSMAESVITPEA